MKKGKILVFGLLLCFAMTVISVLSVGTISASAMTETDALSIERVTAEIFGDKQIKSTEYLYSLNDSPDFIYVDFDNFGYAVFLRETAELLEYAPTGNKWGRGDLLLKAW